MIFTLTFIVSALVLAVILGMFKKSTYIIHNPKHIDDGDFKISGGIKIAAVVIVPTIIGLVNPLSVERIDSGYVGIKVDQTGGDSAKNSIEFARGWVLYNTWLSRIYEFPIYQQHVDYPENVVITRGGFQTTIKPSLNYSINPGSVDNMFQNLRKNVKEIQDEWLKNAIVSSVNDVANLYTVDSIFNHRAEFEVEIVKECNKRVSKWFTVSQLRTNIVPPDALRNSIEQKTKAIQEVQVAENQRQVAVAEAARKVATARGDSAEAVIQAAGRAEAVRREQQTLTPLYIEYLKIKTWNGQMPQVVSDAGMIINLPGTKK